MGDVNAATTSSILWENPFYRKGFSTILLTYSV